MVTDDSYEGYTLPTSAATLHQQQPSRRRAAWRPWLLQRFGSSSSAPTTTTTRTGTEEQGRQQQGQQQSLSSSDNIIGRVMSRTNASTTTTTTRQAKWWKVRLGRGMINDVRRRLPFYWSDWTDAWDYRVVPATIYMYFANILPALAFSLDMFTKTNMSFGVNEVLLSSVLGSVVFAVFAAQPLVIVGVTGPITVFNYTVYDIMAPTGTNYFAFMALIGLWSLLMHWILAVTNACNWLKYVTRFSCDIFGFYVAFIYLQKGIQVLTRQGSEEPFYLSIVVSLLVLVIGYLCGVIGDSPLFRHYIRTFIKDYGTPLTVIFFTGFVHIGRMKDVKLSTLPTSKAFFPTIDRGWFVHFWDISIGDVFIAIPFAILLTILFYFDHNVSSLIAQGTEFPLRKPAGFHWDIFLLGLTTGIAGLLGLPFPNGLIPQAPFHTASLCVTTLVSDASESTESKGHIVAKTSHVVEQRFSNLAQGLLTLGTMTGPLLVVLHLIPQGVLAGLFFVMGVQALLSNGMTLKILFLLKDKTLISTSPAAIDRDLKQIKRPAAIWIFVGIQLLGFAATFAITQTIAAVGFPVIILLLIPVRTLLLPKYFTPEELRRLDQPTASPFTMISVGGNFGEDDADVDVDVDGGVDGSDVRMDAGESGEETAVQSGNEGGGVLINRHRDGVQGGGGGRGGEGGIQHQSQNQNQIADPESYEMVIGMGTHRRGVAADRMFK